MKLQSFFGDVSVLKVCKLNTNYAIKFSVPGRNFCQCPSKDVFRYMRAGKAFSCQWLFIPFFFIKRTLPLGENSSKCNYFIDGKHSIDNFNTTELQRFSKLGKPYIHKKTTVKSHSKNKNNELCVKQNLQIH